MILAGTVKLSPATRTISTFLASPYALTRPRACLLACFAALQAIANAKAVTDKPSLIKVSTLIGYGSPNKADTHDVHGAPLGPEETAATRENLKWPYGEFEVPKEVSTGDALRVGLRAWKQLC